MAITIEDMDTLEGAMKSNQELKDRIKELEIQINILNNKKWMLFKDMAVIQSHLRNLCDHEWRRENYLYAPLFCVNCGVEK